MTPGTDLNPKNPGTDFEPHDMDAKGVGWFAFWLVVVLVAVQAFMAACYFGYLKYDRATWRPRTPFSLLTTDTPEPRVIADQRAQLARLRDQEERDLNTYGWVDKPSGAARIPIERAIDLLSQRGLPARERQREP